MRSAVLLALVACASIATADEPAKVDPNLPYRTDSSNAHLPWYRLQPGEFPPPGSEHTVRGELMEADFIHRSGQFRTTNGDLVDFTLLPSAPVLYLDAEADLRDVPIGTLCEFALFQDDRGEFTRAAAVRDEFSRLARQGLVYRIDKVNLDANNLEVTVRKADGPEEFGRSQLWFDAKTRIRKASAPIRPTDLAPGDDLLVNVTGTSPTDAGRCTDIWVGSESRKLATEAQHRTHHAFLRERGLAARIDRVEGKTLTVTLFGDAPSLAALFKRDDIDPARWAKEHRGVDAVVANEELRTYNPPVDRKRSRVLEYQPVPPDSFGGSGVRWVIEPELLLEGFRKGRVIRLFVHPAWRVEDMPFGEGLYTEAPGVRPAIEEPQLYPYRTDFGNEDLPWYRPKPGEFPPLNSHHLVTGELLDVDAAHRSGHFRADRTGEVVSFTMPPYGSILHLNAEADLSDLAPGTRYSFFLHPDDRGAFTRATIIRDEFTEFRSQDLTYRLDAVDTETGHLLLSIRHAPVKDDKDALVQPPDFGRGRFAVTASTRIHRGDRVIPLGELAVGDDLIVQRGGLTGKSRGVCTDIWVGPETFALATNIRHAKHDASLKSRGLPGWIERVDGKTLTVVLFSGHRRDFLDRIDRGVKGDGITLIRADDELRPLGGPPAKGRLRDQQVDRSRPGVYGSSGIRWKIEMDQPDDRLAAGRIVRVSRDGWSLQESPAER